MRGSEGGEIIDGVGLNQIYDVVSLTETTWTIGQRAIVTAPAVGGG